MLQNDHQKNKPNLIKKRMTNKMIGIVNQVNQYYHLINK